MSPLRFRPNTIDLEKRRNPTETAEQEVLVVDDVPEICDLFKGIFRRIRGIPVRLTTETDSARALALARERPFALVVSDFRMRQVDGIDVLRAARERHPAGRRLLMTGYNEIPATIDHIRSAEVDGYLQKPLHAHDLLLLLLDVLQGNEETILRHRAHARELELVASHEAHAGMGVA